MQDYTYITQQQRIPPSKAWNKERHHDQTIDSSTTTTASDPRRGPHLGSQSFYRRGFSLDVLIYLQPGEKLPDCAVLLQLLGRAIAKEQAMLEDADASYTDELSDDIKPREDRDTTSTLLYNELTQIRKEIDTAYGPRGTRTVGLVGDTPREPALLLRLAKKVVERLEDPSVDLGAPVSIRASFARAEAAMVLTPLCQSLEEHIKKVDTEAGEAKASLDLRNPR